MIRMEKKRMPLQHKIIFGYIILVAVIGSMIAILIYERRQMREVEGGAWHGCGGCTRTYTPPIATSPGLPCKARLRQDGVMQKEGDGQ
ncbi:MULTISPECIES: hypothetical protein [Bacteroidales]|uniref:FeoB-associated Cys-rich membrane protein n=1 Tax=Odoribacter splanchnicus TaxID=28118 RepID=A0AAW6FIT6_9BACT|nr:MULTISPECIES: hypothetical protein [Bacteroidales]MDB9206620.1 hypothetical protein [Odoribacter splanchnicus]MDB9213802.1 hypothetical protein [Odoribacter splanchnicus]MDB9223214.1 hypothetical protein [Odoribacter splanchnicus]